MRLVHIGLINLSLLLLSGCASKGMMTAEHNGKMYWNPGNCSQYRYFYSNPDPIKCVNENGQETGQVLYPVDQQQIANYRYNQEQEQKAWDGLNKNLQQTNENMRRNNEQLINMMPKRYDVYLH